MGLRDFSANNDVRSEFDKYKNFSQNELMSELLKKVNQSKQNGTFDKSALLAFVSAISPKLSEDDRKRLLDLIESL